MEKGLLRLARQVLLGITIILILCGAAKVFLPGEGADAIWDFASYVFPPLVTLILGYYFGAKSGKE